MQRSQTFFTGLPVCLRWFSFDYSIITLRSERFRAISISSSLLFTLDNQFTRHLSFTSHILIYSYINLYHWILWSCLRWSLSLSTKPEFTSVFVMFVSVACDWTRLCHAETGAFWVNTTGWVRTVCLWCVLRSQSLSPLCHLKAGLLKTCFRRLLNRLFFILFFMEDEVASFVFNPNLNQRPHGSFSSRRRWG